MLPPLFKGTSCLLYESLRCVIKPEKCVIGQVKKYDRRHLHNRALKPLNLFYFWQVRQELGSNAWDERGGGGSGVKGAESGRPCCNFFFSKLVQSDCQSEGFPEANAVCCIYTSRFAVTQKNLCRGQTSFVSAARSRLSINILIYNVLFDVGA